MDQKVPKKCLSLKTKKLQCQMQLKDVSEKATGGSFYSWWKLIFIKCFISASGNRLLSSVLLFRACFVLVETAIQIKVQPFLIK